MLVKDLHELRIVRIRGQGLLQFTLTLPCQGAGNLLKP